MLQKLEGVAHLLRKSIHKCGLTTFIFTTTFTERDSVQLIVFSQTKHHDPRRMLVKKHRGSDGKFEAWRFPFGDDVVVKGLAGLWKRELVN